MSLMCKLGRSCPDRHLCSHEKLMLAMIVAGLAMGHFVFGWY